MCRIPFEVRALLFQNGVIGLILFLEEKQNESDKKVRSDEKEEC